MQRERRGGPGVWWCMKKNPVTLGLWQHAGYANWISALLCPKLVSVLAWWFREKT